MLCKVKNNLIPFLTAYEILNSVQKHTTFHSQPAQAILNTVLYFWHVSWQSLIKSEENNDFAYVYSKVQWKKKWKVLLQEWKSAWLSTGKNNS